MPILKNFELSHELSRDKRIKAKPHECYYNCFKAMYYCDEYSSATYVEGYMVGEGFYVHHGWLEVNEQIIDPTIPDEHAIYIPGLRFDGGLGISKAIQMLRREGCHELPFFNRFGDQGCDSPEFSKAKLIAERLVSTWAIQDAASRN